MPIPTKHRGMLPQTSKSNSDIAQANEQISLRGNFLRKLKDPSDQINDALKKTDTGLKKELYRLEQVIGN